MPAFDVWDRSIRKFELRYRTSLKQHLLRCVVTDLNWRLITYCSYGLQFDITHTSGVVYLLSSIAGELFKEHSGRLSRVTISTCYYLVAQTGLG